MPCCVQGRAPLVPTHQAGAPAVVSVGRAPVTGMPLPGTAALTWVMYSRSSSGSMRGLIRNISFCRSLAVSTVLGVNCAWLATKETRAGMTISGATSSTSLTSLHTLFLELKPGALVPLHVDHPPIERTRYVVSPPDRWLPPAAAAFRDFLLDEGARKVEAETRRLLAASPEPR